MLLDKVVFVEILAPYASDINKEAYIPHPGFAGPAGEPTNGVRMNIQPATPQMTMVAEGVLGKTFLAFTAASGIVETMRLTVSGQSNLQYIVRGRQLFDYEPLPHSELILFKHEPRS